MQAKKNNETWIQVVVAIIGAVSVIIATYISFLADRSTPSTTISDQLSAQAEEINALTSELTSINEKLNRIDSDLSALAKNPNQNNEALLLNRIEASVSEVQTKVNNLERIIVDNPEKSISIPLMQNDIESMKDLYDARLGSLEQSLDRSINQLYTIVATVTVVIGIGFFGVAWTNLRSTNK